MTSELVPSPYPAGEPSGPGADRLALALTQVPDDVRVELAGAFSDPARLNWARAMTSALALASSAGARAARVVAPGLIELVDRDERSFGLTALAFTQADHHAGLPSDVDRMFGALDSTFGSRGYVLYLRRPVPTNFDPAPIARAVHLWLAAIDRGEWHGNHAIYEDQHVAIELTLTGAERAEDGRARLFTVGPVDALERLSEIDTKIVEQCTQLQEEHGDFPLVCALGSSRPWRMPRGYVQQLLFGTADWVASDLGEVRSYEAGFHPNGRSLFSDPVCRNLTALWWVEQHAGDQLAFASWAYDNPWSIHPDPLSVGGARFAVVQRVPSTEVKTGARHQAVLRWSSTPPTKWGFVP